MFAKEKTATSRFIFVAIIVDLHYPRASIWPHQLYCARTIETKNNSFLPLGCVSKPVLFKIPRRSCVLTVGAHFVKNPSHPGIFGARKLHFDQNYVSVISVHKTHRGEWSDIYPPLPPAKEEK